MSLWLYYKQCRFFSKAVNGRGKLDGSKCWDIVCGIVEEEMGPRVCPRKLYLKNGVAIGKWPQRLKCAKMWVRDDG